MRWKHTAVEPRAGFDTHTGAHWAAIGLAAIGGVIQLSLAWMDGPILFFLPAAMLFAGVISAVADVDRYLLYALGVPFLVAQLFAALMQGLPTRELGVLSVAVEITLLGLLVYLFLGERTLSEQTVERARGFRSTGNGSGSSHRTHGRGDRR